MKKRILSLVLTIIMLLSVAGIPVFAAGTPSSGVCGDNLTWNLDSKGTLTISGTGEMWDYTSENPSPWRYLSRDIDVVIIEEGVTTIGDRAFASFSYFEDAFSFSTIILPKSLETIGYNAFVFANIGDLTVWDGIVCDEHAFVDGTIALLRIEDGSKEIPESLINWASYVDIPVSVTEISAAHAYSYLFYRGTEEQWELVRSASKAVLEDQFPDFRNQPRVVYNVKECGYGFCIDRENTLIVMDTNSLNESYGNLYDVAPWYQFRNEVVAIDIRQYSHSDIHRNAFKDFSKVKSVRFSEVNIHEIYESAFENCTSIEEVYYVGSKDAWDSFWIKEGNECLTNAEFTFYDTTDWSVEDGVLTISGSGPMMDYEFDNIGHSQPWMQDYETAATIERAIIEDGITAIGDGAFRWLTSLQTVTIGKDVAEINPWAFEYSSTAKIEIDENNPWLKIKDGAIVDKAGTTMICYPYPTEECVVPFGVAVIAPLAASINAAYETIIIPEGVTTIGKMAFMAENLKAVYLPKSIKTIEIGAFYNYRNIKEEVEIFYGGTEEDWKAIEAMFDAGFDREYKVYFHTHSYTSEVIEPTCTEDGYTRYICECGDSYDDNIVAAPGHNEVIDAAVAANCTEAGLTEGKHCSVCGEVLVKQEEVPATNHKWDEGKVTTEPTEETEGVKTFTCSACGETKTETIAKLEHTHKYNSVTTSPTCTEGGYTLHTCACGDSYVDSTVAAIGHKWDGGRVTKEPTEEAEGIKTFTCTVCNETKTETLPVLNHTHKYTSVVTAPTCTEDGYTTHTCACGDSYTDSTVAAIGHKWDNGKVTKEPTEETEGEKTYTCSVCGETNTEAIAKLNHTHKYTSVVTAPSCIAEGYTTHTCACGDSYKDSTVAALGHKWDGGKVTKEPTTSAEGEKTFTCTVCSETKIEKIDKLPEEPKPDEPIENPFTDVVEKDFFFEPVMWAVSNNVTSGLSATSFGPAKGCTRAQVVTFLWRAAGEPAPTSNNNPFADVKEGQYYYDAVLWAVENGITTGLNATTFGTNADCNRGQIVTFLWRAMGKPAPLTSNNPFTDVPETQYYYDAVLWAVEKGITTGLSATSFGPNSTCTRGQIVTFLYRAYQ